MGVFEDSEESDELAKLRAKGLSEPQSKSLPMELVQQNKLKLDMFSNARIDLMAEVNQHETLCQLLHAIGIDADWEEQLAEITAYCNVMMDGDYLARELEELYPQLTQILRNDRSSVVAVHAMKESDFSAFALPNKLNKPN